MEPFEWLLLGVGLAVGSLLGSQGKGLVRTAAKGYYTLEEKTKMWTANMREDFQDAVEEARYERDEETAHGTAASGAALSAEPARASNGRKRGATAASGTRSRAPRKSGTRGGGGSRGGGTRTRGGATGRRGRNAAAETGGAAENTETT